MSPAQDPHGLFPAWNALVFYLSCLAAMFLLVNFDLWPLTTLPGVMRQPTLGIVWTGVAIVLGGMAFYIGVVAHGDGRRRVHGAGARCRSSSARSSC